ncbi:SMI1/KNR4 family protein [Maribacter sp. R86514]|uniref:SMI1/KNR4 family protein n=1 Tax=Maribacter sp. R86514 TaxID=3093854 RepID=UPI0037C583F0
MNTESIPYNNQLKKLNFQDIEFNRISFERIPELDFKDYSDHKRATSRNYKAYDKMGFRDILLERLSGELENKVLKLFIITPKSDRLPYDAFAYLSNKEIVAMHFENKGNFKLWMDFIFENQYQTLEEYKNNGQFERQPELNPNPQFMLTLGKGQFSQKWVNSGMLIDNKPYENMGVYLYKNAPKQYQEAKIAKEKQNYIKKYIRTELPQFDEERLFALWKQLVDVEVSKPIEISNYSKEYQEFKELTEFDFPENLKTFYQIPNARLNSNGFNLMTLNEIIEEWKNWKKIYDDPNWMLVDLTGNNSADGRKTIGMYTNPYWIPFMTDGGGNFVAMDFAPGSKGTSGQIIAFGADEIKIRCLAENLTDFLQQINDGKDVLNNGFEK